MAISEKSNSEQTAAIKRGRFLFGASVPMKNGACNVVCYLCSLECCHSLSGMKRVHKSFAFEKPKIFHLHQKRESFDIVAVPFRSTSFTSIFD